MVLGTNNGDCFDSSKYGESMHIASSVAKSVSGHEVVKSLMVVRIGSAGSKAGCN